MYAEFAHIALMYPGWSLTEIKQMPKRERRFWIALETWRREHAR